MRRPMLYTVRFLMIAVLLAALTLLPTPRSGQGSPYRSALASFSSSPALAATCAMTSCGRDKEGRSICVPSGATTSCKTNRSGHSCTATAC